MAITAQDIEAADIDGSSKALFADVVARLAALESAAVPAPEITAMTAESPDGQGGVTVARYEKV